MIKDSLRLTFKAAMMHLPKQAQDFMSEVTSPKFKKDIYEAIKSGALRGVEILSAPINPDSYRQPQLATIKPPK